MQDNRNVTDEFKGQHHEAIVDILYERGVELEIAIENTLRDYNMGSVVRTANAFGVRTIHVIGRKQWNKRGAMMTDKYLSIKYYASVIEFSSSMQQREKRLYALENNVSSKSIYETKFKKNAVIIIGQEGPGISEELLSKASEVVAIDQLGSTRSMNVSVAAGIGMYEWSRQHR